MLLKCSEGELQFVLFSDKMSFDQFDYKGAKFAKGVHTEESINYAENEFEVFDDDIYNVTYPKSGN